MYNDLINQIMKEIQPKNLIHLIHKLQNHKFIHLKKLIINKTSFLDNFNREIKLNERLFCIHNNIFSPNLCQVCNENLKTFKSLTQGYGDYCSRNCFLNKKTVSRTKNNFQLYSKDQINQIIQKISKKTFKGKLSVIQLNLKFNNLKNSIIYHTSFLDIVNPSFSQRYYHIYYNINHIVNCKKCKNFVCFLDFSRGYQTYCSNKCAMNDPEIINKIKNTLIKKYGKIHHMQVKSIREKTKKTNLKKYGFEFVSQVPKFKEKIIETNLKKRGVKYPTQSSAVQEKIIETNLKKRGVKNVFQSLDVQKKIIKTNLKKFGCENAMQNFHIRQKYKFQKLKNNYKHIKSSKRIGKEYELLTTLEEYKGVKYNYLKFKHKKCDHIFESSIANGRIPRCPKCYSNNKSFIEDKIVSFCKEYFPNLIHNTRRIISPYELDIYIPEKKLAIEFNGLYWHSEAAGKDKYYHQNKTLLCLEQGINLVQIFEDEWLYKQDIIKSILLNKFGLTKNKIYARKCKIDFVYPDYARQWLDENHLQGSINGKHYGLIYENELVCMITVGKSRFDKSVDLEIYRFANKLNTQVIGGLSRLIKHVKKIHNPTSIITYADLRFGIGQGYQSIGFKFKGITEAGYFYSKGQSRYSRQQFQKHKLKSKLKNFDETLTECQNMFENGYSRIWDCGNTIYIL